MAARSDGTFANVSLKVIAVAVAFVVWVVAISERSRTSPALTFDVVVQAPLEVTDLASDMLVVGIPDHVSARLRGPKELESSPLPAVTAECDLGGLGPGRHSVIPAVTPPIPFELVNAPGRILVELETVGRRAFDVEAPAGFSAVPHSVEFVGTASALAQVRRAVAVTLSGSTASVIAVDEHGFSVAGVDAFPGGVGIVPVAAPPVRIGDEVPAGQGTPDAGQLMLTLDDESNSLR